jgi:mevalonate kinase
MSPEEAVGHASGKVILLGEHAVVYGVEAIAAGLDRGATARVTRAAADSISVEGSQVEESSALLKALAQVRQDLGCGTVHVELSLEIPAGSGLGASAAMGVATTRALATLFEIELSQQRLFSTAQSWEKVFHGNPSGVDVAAAAHARPIRFSKVTDPEPLLMKKPLRILVAQAGPPASTKEMVDGVARLKARNPGQFDKTLEAIAALVENASLLMRSGDLAAVGKLMDLNQMLLAGWMLSTEELEKACRLARDAGALGSKLTGAGGGGCVIALAGEAGDSEAEQRAAAIIGAWKQAELPCFSAEIRGEDSKLVAHHHGEHK